MKKVQLTNNLWLHEYIPEEFYKKWIHKPHYLIGLLDKDLVEADQKLRDTFGVLWINNWVSGGVRNWSGVRLPETQYYSFFSQYTRGNGSDKIFRDVHPEEVREYLKKNNNHENFGITCIEEKPNAPREEDLDWLHSDTRFHKFGGLLIVNP